MGEIGAGGLGVGVFVGLTSWVLVGEGWDGAGVDKVGDIVIVAEPSKVAEAVGAEMSEGSGLGWGGPWVSVGLGVLADGVIWVAAIVVGVPVVFRGGRTMGVCVDTFPPV